MASRWSSCISQRAISTPRSEITYSRGFSLALSVMWTGGTMKPSCCARLLRKRLAPAAAVVRRAGCRPAAPARSRLRGSVRPACSRSSSASAAGSLSAWHRLRPAVSVARSCGFAGVAPGQQPPITAPAAGRRTWAGREWRPAPASLRPASNSGRRAESNCCPRSVERLVSEEARVTTMPPAIETSSDGIMVTSPSPTVSTV